MDKADRILEQLAQLSREVGIVTDICRRTAAQVDNNEARLRVVENAVAVAASERKGLWAALSRLRGTRRKDTLKEIGKATGVGALVVAILETIHRLWGAGG